MSKEQKPKSTFEFPGFKLEFEGTLTKEQWKRIKKAIDSFLEGVV